MARVERTQLTKPWSGTTRGAGAVFLAALTGTLWLAHADEPVAAVPLPPKRSSIEVVFALDTTGSMDGLIEGAKQKIWSIASELARANDRPELRIGLIGYRDRGDDYVTRRFDLDTDIDAVYAALQQFQAGGGGDAPESVNQALREAVHDMSWSLSGNAYRVIFLVGDAPPHEDYAQDVAWETSIDAARARGIVVNAIQCGSDPSTQEVWQKIAQLSQGEYVALAQDGAMVAESTPMDGELVGLQEQLAATALAFGDEEHRRELGAALEAAAAAPPSSAAARLSYLDKKGGRLSSGTRDLVDALAADEVKLEELAPSALPEPMQALAPKERAAYVEKRKNERKDIQAKISTLVKQRDEYLSAERARREAEGGPTEFDARVLNAVRAQAAEKGIEY